MLFVTETNLDIYDVIDIPNYMFINKPRKQKYYRKSGGLGAFVDKKLAKNVEEIENNSDYALWLKLKPLTNQNSEIIFGIIYIPPSQSRFFNDDELELLESEITSMCSKYDNVFLAGDMNAQTANMKDYTECDTFLADHFDFDADTRDFLDQRAAMENLGIILNRVSQDSKKNNHGYKLIDICKNNNMVILNGRFGKDKNIGKKTFRNTSVLDYIISSLAGFKLLQDFEVIPMDKLHGDGHALLNLQIMFQTKQNNTIQESTSPKYLWQNEKSTQYNDNLNTCKLQKIEQNINNANVNEINQAFIDNLVHQINGVLTDSADATLERKTPKKTKFKGKHKKPWFGPECKAAKKRYNKARKKYFKNPTLENETNMFLTCKKYKNTMNKHIRQFKKVNESKLRNLNKSNPKEYWKYLNRLKNKKNPPEVPNINEMFNYFKTINEADSPETEQYEIEQLPDINDPSNPLNMPITDAEIKKNIDKLKNAKSPAGDMILNEFIKSTKDKMIDIYALLFNMILEKGVVPNQWLEGIIIPIYKNKGNSLDPGNYRPITLLSCLGKLFTSILSNRLNTFLENNDLLNENQAGFRKNYATVDHIFTLNSVIELLRFQKKKIFTAFIDFSKAFDSVWRVGLLRKLIENGITGKFFKIIKNMYGNIKSCVSFNGQESLFFNCQIGVRQGENLSPALFAIYLNDLENYLNERQSNGITLRINEDPETFLKILLLLYADDTVIITDNAESMHECLLRFSEYCRTWKLKINTEKSKIVIFGSKRATHIFNVDGNNLEIVDSYKYLGTIFSKSGSFLTARTHITEQARKALYLLYARIENLDLPIDLQLKLFDHTILPILTYSCEVWGYENCQILERVHLSFLKRIIKAKKSTPNYMVYSELGRYPLEITIKTRMIAYWSRLLNGKETKLSRQIYNTMVNKQAFQSKWVKSVKSILTDIGRPDIWESQNVTNTLHISKKVSQILKDQFFQNMNSSSQESTKRRNYFAFKNNFTLEKYLLTLPKSLYIPLAKFRTGNHRFPVETGRWLSVDYQDRKCKLCNRMDIGDEYHYLFVCEKFCNERNKYLKRYFNTHPNMFKFSQIMNTVNGKELKSLAYFVKIILRNVS